jgi:hypothetical protein
MKILRSTVMRNLRSNYKQPGVNVVSANKKTPTWPFWPRMKNEIWNTTYSIFNLFRGSDSPGSFTFSSSDETLATVDTYGTYTTYNKSGTVTITATQAETEQYTSLTRTFNLNL